MTRRLSMFLTVALLAVTCAGALSGPKTFRVDLDGRGTVGIVGLEHYTVKSTDSFDEKGTPTKLDRAQLVVKGTNGRVIWAGPRTTNGDTHDPLVFGRGEFDGGELEIVGRFGTDPSVRLIGEGVYSDVGPHPHRLFRWDGKAFRFVRRGVPVQTRMGSGRYVWGDRTGSMPVRWIDHFDRILPDGSCRVTVMSMSVNGVARRYTITVVETSDGFREKPSR